MNNFQTVLISIFLALFVFAVLIFSGILKIGDKRNNANILKGRVIVWGTLSATDFYKIFEKATGENRDLSIRYIRKSPIDYQQSLIEAFAIDQGPDLFFITPEMIYRNRSFFYKIPYQSYPEKIYRDSFIDGAEIFLDSDGIIAFPLVVDPMVMYFNKNILTNEGLSLPPVFWEDLVFLNDKLTQKGNAGQILTSMIGLGRYDNVSNAKEILATLLLQSNNQIVKKEGEKYISDLSQNVLGSSKSSLEKIIDSLIQFSSPNSAVYSWNKSLPNSFDLFVSGKLAFYLGKASELFKIQEANPNLSFDVSQILQTKNANKRTFGDIYALAVNKKSKNSTLAFGVVGLLTKEEIAQDFSKILSLPSAFKTLLSKSVESSYLYTFNNSAIFTRSWVDPNPQQTNLIFNELFENVLSNKLEVPAAVYKSHGQLNQILK
jgi:ABC-type glycerol-3-phosphate transport system substrate-binding protein